MPNSVWRHNSGQELFQFDGFDLSLLLGREYLWNGVTCRVNPPGSDLQNTWLDKMFFKEKTENCDYVGKKAWLMSMTPVGLKCIFLHWEVYLVSTILTSVQGWELKQRLQEQLKGNVAFEKGFKRTNFNIHAYQACQLLTESRPRPPSLHFPGITNNKQHCLLCLCVALNFLINSTITA